MLMHMLIILAFVLVAYLFAHWWIQGGGRSGHASGLPPPPSGHMQWPIQPLKQHVNIIQILKALYISAEILHMIAKTLSASGGLNPLIT